jgi:hypothetical protein
MAGPLPVSQLIHSFAAHIQEKTRGFVGRGWIMQRIDEHLKDREKFPSGYILITGEPGIGKSALLAQLVKECGYFHHFNIALQGIRSPRHFLTNVCAQLIVRYATSGGNVGSQELFPLAGARRLLRASLDSGCLQSNSLLPSRRRDASKN